MRFGVITVRNIVRRAEVQYRDMRFKDFNEGVHLMRGRSIAVFLAAVPALAAIPILGLAVAETGQSVVVASRASKICQLLGDQDLEKNQPTLNRTWTRYKLYGTDLGVPFGHNGRTYLVFGDTVGAGPRNADTIAFTTDTNPEDGMELEFIHNANGVYRPVKIPGIGQGAFEVPMEGTSVGGKMYLYHTTDAGGNPARPEMGRSVVAVSQDDGRTFTYLYDLSRRYFINVSVVESETPSTADSTQSPTPLLYLFGSGKYRASDVRLAVQPASRITDPAALRYLTGLDGSGRAVWSEDENGAVALFNQPCVGELSVSYNRFLRKWLMLYNCSGAKAQASEGLRGINLRTADQPWGPWSPPQVIFDPWADNGYGHFIHVSWKINRRDNVFDPKRENESGGEYGPYQFAELATGVAGTTTIYFTMSTWNPYTVVLMKATLREI